MVRLCKMFSKWFVSKKNKRRGVAITDKEFEIIYNDVVRTMKVAPQPEDDYVKTVFVDCPLEIEAGLFQMLEEDEMDFVISQNYEMLITYSKSGDPVGFVGYYEDGRWLDIHTLFMYIDYCHYWAIKEQINAVAAMAPQKRLRMYAPDQLPPDAQRAYYDCGLEAAATCNGATRWVKPVRSVRE
tara:strand:+ start:4003 stop:4554 length:552 start_codon:yes stop_codon:yes gene_type:complete